MHLSPTPLLVPLFAMLVATVQPLSAASPAGSATLPAPTRFTTDQLLGHLGPDLASHFNLEGDLTLELLRPWTPPTTTAGRWQVVVDDYPASPASSLLLRCHLLADGNNVAEYTFVLHAALWRDAWSTRQPLTAQATFDPACLEVRRVDVLRDRNAVPSTAGDGSFVFARAVPAGRLLTWTDLAPRPLVRKGALVDVSAIEGMLCVNLKAIALENGAKGETITLRNRESRKDFSATVVDENQVQVHF